MCMHYDPQPNVNPLCVNTARASPKPEKHNTSIFVSLRIQVTEVLLHKLLINTKQKASLCPKELAV